MISFRPMSQAEFPDYLAYFVPDYAAEIAQNYALPAAEARTRAESEIGQDLPQGPQTPGQTLFCILKETSGAHIVGYIWFRSDTIRRSVFVCDFCILPQYRGKGCGHEALAAFERLIRDQGFDEIRLRVAADNARAQHVYSVGGFRVTGLNMAKRIAEPAKPD